MYKYLISAIALAFSAGMAFAAPTVTITSVKQRFPWNGKVDIEYSISGTERDRTYFIEFMVSNMTQNKQCVWTNQLASTTGALSTVWDSAATTDFGVGFNGDVNLVAKLISMPVLDKDTGLEFQVGDYIVWDILEGTVTDVKGVTTAEYFNTDEYKTSKMAFRKIPAGTFYMQGTTGDEGADPGNLVSLSEAYYMAVFEFTSAHYQRIVNGSATGSTTPWGYNWTAIRGDGSVYNWPTVIDPEPSSFVGKANARLPSNYRVDLPTTYQWERACRAGTRTECYWGSGERTKYAWCRSITGEGNLQIVGTKLPNAWGLYDLCGNEWELCIDNFTDPIPYGVDPVSTVTASSKVLRGGAVGAGLGDATCSSNFKTYLATSATHVEYGGRLVLTNK